MLYCISPVLFLPLLAPSLSVAPAVAPVVSVAVAASAPVVHGPLRAHAYICGLEKPVAGPLLNSQAVSQAS